MDAWKEGHQLSIEALAVSHQFHVIILYDYWHTRSDLLCVIGMHGLHPAVRQLLIHDNVMGTLASAGGLECFNFYGGFSPHLP